MVRVISCSLSILIVGLLFASIAHADEDAEWIDLLQDNDLSQHWTTEGNWSIDDEGVVSLVPREGERGWTRYRSYLWLDGEYIDFEFEFDYVVQRRGNSGLFFHVDNKDSAVTHGIEVQIFDSGSKPMDAVLNNHDAGGIIPGPPPTTNAANPAGEWNHFHIRCQGNDLTVTLNGEVVNQIKLDHLQLTNGNIIERPDHGSIGFQDIAKPLLLRNIRIREL